MEERWKKEMEAIEADIARQEKEILRLMKVMKLTVEEQQDRAFPAPCFPDFVRQVSDAILRAYNEINDLEIQKDILERIGGK